MNGTFANNDVVAREPSLARRVQPVKADLERLLWAIGAPPDAVNVEHDLDRLIDSPGWQHPSQVLGAQRIEYQALIAACRRRLTSTQGRPRERIEQVLDQLEGAFRMTKKAWTVQLRQLKERIRDLVNQLPTA